MDIYCPSKKESNLWNKFFCRTLPFSENWFWMFIIFNAGIYFYRKRRIKIEIYIKLRKQWIACKNLFKFFKLNILCHRVTLSFLETFCVTACTIGGHRDFCFSFLSDVENLLSRKHFSGSPECHLALLRPRPLASVYIASYFHRKLLCHCWQRCY